METSKRRQIPTTNAYPNFSFRGLRKKNFITLFCDYFRHAYKLYTSQRQPSTRTDEFTMAAAGRAYGPTRAAPGIIEEENVRGEYVQGECATPIERLLGPTT